MKNKPHVAYFSFFSSLRSLLFKFSRLGSLERGAYEETECILLYIS